MTEFIIASWAIILVGFGLTCLVSCCNDISDRAIERNNTWIGDHF